jgi:predicted ribosomally synthesized peptide with SipW-like signal peptide
MPFSKRKIAIAGTLGVAALGLVGVGTGATFTDAVNTTQQVTAGTINVQLSSTDSSVAISNDGKTATFADLGPTQSVFSSGNVPTVITNNGTASANAIQLSASSVYDHTNAASTALHSQMCVQVISPISGATAYDGPLTGLENNPLALVGPIPAGQTDSFTTRFYAGGPDAGPGCATDGLTNAAEGGVVTPKVTVTYNG